MSVCFIKQSSVMCLIYLKQLRFYYTLICQFSIVLNSAMTFLTLWIELHKKCPIHQGVVGLGDITPLLSLLGGLGDL